MEVGGGGDVEAGDEWEGEDIEGGEVFGDVGGVVAVEGACGDVGWLYLMVGVRWCVFGSRRGNWIIVMLRNS